MITLISLIAGIPLPTIFFDAGIDKILSQISIQQLIGGHGMTLTSLFLASAVAVKSIEEWLLVLERLSLALLLGGGVMMSAGVRPLLLRALTPDAQESLVALVDDIRVNSWGWYNQAALLSGLVMMAVLWVRGSFNGDIPYLSLSTSALIVLALVRKLVIDRRLKTRLSQGLPAHGSSVDDSEQKELTFWTVSVLVLALVLAVSPIW